MVHRNIVQDERITTYHAACSRYSDLCVSYNMPSVTIDILYTELSKRDAHWTPLFASLMDHPVHRQNNRMRGAWRVSRSFALVFYRSDEYPAVRKLYSCFRIAIVRTHELLPLDRYRSRTLNTSLGLQIWIAKTHNTESSKTPCCECKNPRFGFCNIRLYTEAVQRQNYGLTWPNYSTRELGPLSRFYDYFLLYVCWYFIECTSG